MNPNEKKIIQKSQSISIWHTQKLYFSTARSHQRAWTVKRGEVYFVDLGENIGSEQNGRRPVVAISSGMVAKSPVFICAIISTSTISQQNIQVPISGTYPYKDHKGRSRVLTGAVDLGQIRTVAKERIVSHKICSLKVEMPEIDKKIASVLGLHNYISKRDNVILSLQGKVNFLQNQIKST